MARGQRDLVVLEHSMPGRARLRVPKPRSAQQVRSIARRAGRTKHVRDVEVNPATGSVLLSFPSDDPIDLVIDELRLVGLEIRSIARPTDSIHTESRGAAVVRGVLGRSNAQLHLLTRGQVDLRLAVPAAYMALAGVNFIRRRGRLSEAAWYQLLYWAFDSFFKLHEQATVARRSGPRAHTSG